MNPQAGLIPEGRVDSAAFLTYLEHLLLPTLGPGPIVMMDNFTIHHKTHLRTLLESKGCQLLSLPTYSPDFNPSEYLFANIKAFIPNLPPTSLPALSQTFEDALLTLTQHEAKNAFIHCGYLSQ
jgi:transposase